MNIKRFIFNRLFNERQRRVIWDAVLFSEHTYKRRGNVDGAARVRTVINEVANTAATKQRTFLESQVLDIVNSEVEAAIENERKTLKQKLNKAYRRGISDAEKKMMEELEKVQQKSILVKGGTIDRERCDTCEIKDTCIVRQAIDEVEQEEAESVEHVEQEIESPDSKEQEDTDKAQEHDADADDKPEEDTDDKGDGDGK